MIIKAFKERVQKSGERIAVKSDDCILTYKELDIRTQNLGVEIKAEIEKIKGSSEKLVIALLFEHGADMIVGSLGALKARVIYSPFDPTYPESRLLYMLNDSGARLIVTNDRSYDLAARLASTSDNSVNVLNISNRSLSEFKEAGVRNEDRDELAYLLYTSGSTGRPKGVIQTQRNVLYFANSYINTLGLTENDRLTLFSAFSHDASIIDIYSGILSGACIYPYNMKEQSSIEKLAEWLVSQEITVWHSVPTLYRYFLNTLSEKEEFHKLRYSVLGGENVLDYDVKEHRKLLGNVTMVNLYGQSESSYNSSQFIEYEEDFSGINMGTAIPGTQIMVLNERGRKVPALRMGEIVVASEHLAPGYWKDEEKTKAVFEEHPEFGRIYRTGDIGWVNLEGNIEYRGRKDFQVKVRGYRVELEEIENCLIQCSLVKDAAVVGKTDINGETALYAYIVSDNPVSTAELRAYLTKLLPDYMVPSYFIQLEKMPLTGTNKIDRAALAKIESIINETGAEYEAARNEAEEKLIAIWKEVLKVEKISINDSFFDLGGHSLKAAIVTSKIYKILKVKVPIKRIFDTPTIKGLSDYISEQEESIYSCIEPVEEKEYYGLSSAQKRLYTLQQFELKSTGYNMPRALEIEGKLEIERLEQAFKKLIERHEAFRTSFELIGEEIVQKIYKEVEFAVEHKEAREEDVEGILRSFIRPFDLSKAPLLRVGLIALPKDKELGPERHILMYDMHHIISDGTSMGILVDEFARLYDCKELPYLRLQYKDYAAWQNNMLNSEVMKTQEEHWLKTFEGEIPVLNLPIDYPRPSIQSFEGDRIHFELDKEITKGLQKMAKEAGATMYMVLLAGFTILLSKYSGQEDIIIGSPIAGRPNADFQNIMGIFVNTLAMRNYPESRKTIAEFIEEVKANALRAYENQDYQFEELVERLNIKRDIGRNPIFDVVLAMQNTDMKETAIEGISIKPCRMENRISKFDIALDVLEAGEKLSIRIEYCSRLFNKETIERMAGHLKNVLRSMSGDTGKKISELELLDEEERQKLLYEFNDTYTEYPKDKTIQELFEEQTDRTPYTTAVIYEDRQLTYRELNERANQLAKLLRGKGIVPGSIVGIIVEKSLELIVGIMGILKAGGAYLPIDPEYPAERIRYMLEDSGANILLVQNQTRGRAVCGGEIIEIDDDRLYTGDGSNLEVVNGPNDLAYVIYTSGSTGKPKGVMIEHKSVLRLVKNTNFIEFKKDDKILQTGAIVFDAITFEVWGALLNSLSLYLVAKDKILDGDKLKHEIVKNGITTIWLTASLFNQIVDQNPEVFAGCRNLLVGGDVLSPKHINEIRKRDKEIKIINGYGPTENTTFTACFSIENIYDANIPIGKPISNTRVYIVDPNNKLQPIGVAGELCTAGEGLARGYLNRPELTEEKFVDNPFEPGTRMYKTGDMARWLPDGNIEFFGRIDCQVKIRGYRIELGEIENQILKHPDIKEAVVIDRVDKEGSKYLCAYITGDRLLETAELRDYLNNELPDYMIPSYFIQLDKIPLTSNGKTDRKALPEPDGSIVASTEYEAPRNDIEEKLVTIWQEVLKVERVGIKDNFFELGGDSIKAIQISARMQRYGYKLQIRNLLKCPSIGELSKYVETGIRAAEQGVVTGEAELTPIQSWFFKQQFVEKHHWNQSVMLYSREGFEEDIIKKAFTKIVEHHDILRSIYTEEKGRIIQRIRGLDTELFTLRTYDFGEERDCRGKITEEAEKLQGSINLSEGPLVKLGLFKTADGDHLLIAIHHLVVDGVSWRILFEDLKSGYKQAKKGKEIELPHKTASYKEWGDTLKEYSSSKELLKEIGYWEELEKESEANLVEKDKEVQYRKVKDRREIIITLPEEETEKLLKQANRAYNTEINDLLLAALGMAVKEWAGKEKVVIDLEGHGRERIGEIDITRTIGWFTSIYPVILNMAYSENIGYQIKVVKEALRQIPNKGIGYGVLRYLALPENSKKLEFNTRPEISFNYLGQFDSDIKTGVFDISQLSGGSSMSLESEVAHAISMNGMVAGGRLRISIGYNNLEYDESTIEKLSERYAAELIRLVEHCISKEDTEITPCDISTSVLNLKELEEALDIFEQMGEA